MGFNAESLSCTHFWGTQDHFWALIPFLPVPFLNQPFWTQETLSGPEAEAEAAKGVISFEDPYVGGLPLCHRGGRGELFRLQPEVREVGVALAVHAETRPRVQSGPWE